ncbi:hypothetical protein TRFO_39556 [Tritrichomonas foetus]|uniref:RRM domain-containing protein n=1 Tax=Tritrichomonas foetus TaxID=1144522 RepID=A0A1J4J4I7_9EUKA|nr:hypothetical protein TRFO_39556 [Tritrichomonas foetus]|eukprot:OHS94262.1 hypothetical protein TRFO_39556 [Tritrichomonas foetus]
MQEDKHQYFYLIETKNKDNIDPDKLKQFVRSILGKVSYTSTDYASYYFVKFTNPVISSVFNSFFEANSISDFKLYTVPDSDAPAAYQLYLTNLPKEYSSTEIVNIIQELFAVEFSHEDKMEGVLTVIFIIDESLNKNIINSFLPFVKFANGITINVTTDPLEVPIITVSNLPYNFRMKEFSIFKCPHQYVQCKFQQVAQDGQEKSPKTAYLSYASNQEANEAVEFFNFAQIDSNEISAVHFFDKKVTNLEQWEICVRHISPESRAFDVWQRFKIYGKLLKTEIIHKANTSLYATVQFYDQETARKAIDDIKNQESSLTIDFTFDLFVTIYNINPSLKAEEIASSFSNVSRVDIIKSKRGTLCSAVVTFLTTQSALNCLNSDHTHKNVRWIFRKGKNDSNMKEEIKRLFKNYSEENAIKIRNLPAKFTLDQLIELCSQYGVIRYLSISDIAIVSFEQKQNALSAISSLNNCDIGQNRLSVEEI